MMTQIKKKTFVERYADFYYQGEKTNSEEEELGITNLAKTKKDIEQYIIENNLSKGNIDENVIAWKAGTLDSTKYPPQPKLKNENLINGYGKTIDKNKLTSYFQICKNSKKDILSLSQKELNEYIKTCRKSGKEKTDMEAWKSGFEKIYKLLLSGVPQNFGSVYIINLLYFISQGRLPIYDQFAHRAVKSLFLEKSFGVSIAPTNIFIGTAPAKKDTKTVFNMYSEYIWLLVQVFGTETINPVRNLDDRKLDQALWVYGHCIKPYTEEKS